MPFRWETPTATSWKPTLWKGKQVDKLRIFTPSSAAPIPSLGPSLAADHPLRPPPFPPPVHTCSELPRSFPTNLFSNSLLYPSLQLLQAHPETPLATPAREAGRLEQIIASRSAPPNPPPVWSPALQQNVRCRSPSSPPSSPVRHTDLALQISFPSPLALSKPSTPLGRRSMKTYRHSVQESKQANDRYSLLPPFFPV